MLTIGTLAKKTGTKVQTIRYYERRGLLPAPRRNKSGHRRYSVEAVNRTVFIKRCQALGFSLNEIQEILSLRVTPESTCADMKLRVSEKVADVELILHELTRIRDALNRLLSKCAGTGPIGKCPILDELYH